MAQISIVIPVYNASKTLDQCLRAIYNQTYGNFGIIAVNDGSTDGSRRILERYSDRITIIDQPNAGAAIARNSGAKIVKSPYIIFCDADVILEPDCLEKMLDALQRHPEASYAYCSFYFGKKLFKLWPFDAEKLRKIPYIHTTSLILTEHFPGFDKKLKRFQDWDLWLTMLERGYAGYFIDEVLYRIISGGTMSNWLPKISYYLPFLPGVRKYVEAKRIIEAKHKL